jgi:hypothetical protein
LNVLELKNLFIIRTRDFTTLLKERLKDFTIRRGGHTELTELFLTLKKLFIIRARDFTTLLKERSKNFTIRRGGHTEFTEIIKYFFRHKN